MMQISLAPQMQAAVQQVLTALGLWEAFQTQTEFAVELENAPFMPLVIERQGDYIHLAHTFIQHGDVMHDPLIIFHFPTWTPVELEQDRMGVRRTKFRGEGGQEYVDTRFHPEVMALVNLWARNLRSQGWSQQAQVIPDPD